MNYEKLYMDLLHFHYVQGEEVDADLFVAA
jgi:hypothetical protein